jgi:hypothetical protein
MKTQNRLEFVPGRFADKGMICTQTGIKRFLSEDPKAWPRLAAVAWAGFLLRGLGCVEIASIQLAEGSEVVSCSISTCYITMETMRSTRRVTAAYDPETTVLIAALELIDMRSGHGVIPFKSPDGALPPPAAFAALTPAAQVLLVNQLQGRA